MDWPLYRRRLKATGGERKPTDWLRESEDYRGVGLAAGASEREREPGFLPPFFGRNVVATQQNLCVIRVEKDGEGRGAKK